MSETLTYAGKLTVVACWCGIRHAIPAELDDFQDRQHDNGQQQRGIYCPLGHSHIRAGDGEAAESAGRDHASPTIPPARRRHSEAGRLRRPRRLPLP